MNICNVAKFITSLDIFLAYNFIPKAYSQWIFWQFGSFYSISNVFEFLDLPVENVLLIGILYCVTTEGVIDTVLTEGDTEGKFSRGDCVVGSSTGRHFYWLPRIFKNVKL